MREMRREVSKSRRFNVYGCKILCTFESIFIDIYSKFPPNDGTFSFFLLSEMDPDTPCTPPLDILWNEEQVDEFDLLLTPETVRACESIMENDDGNFERLNWGLTESDMAHYSSDCLSNSYFNVERQTQLMRRRRKRTCLRCNHDPDWVGANWRKKLEDWRSKWKKSLSPISRYRIKTKRTSRCRVTSDIKVLIFNTLFDWHTRKPILCGKCF